MPPTTFAHTMLLCNSRLRSVGATRPRFQSWPESSGMAATVWLPVVNVRIYPFAPFTRSRF